MKITAQHLSCSRVRKECSDCLSVGFILCLFSKCFNIVSISFSFAKEEKNFSDLLSVVIVVTVCFFASVQTALRRLLRCFLYKDWLCASSMMMQQSARINQE